MNIYMGRKSKERSGGENAKYGLLKSTLEIHEIPREFKEDASCWFVNVLCFFCNVF